MNDLFEFLRALRQSNLLSDPQWAQLQDAVADAPLRTPLEVCAWLVSRNAITPWQSQMLLAGKRAFFLGKYRLEELLGTGGMGAVFRARQPGLERGVALKVLSPRVIRDPDIVQRFRKEMQAVAALSDPHIITAYDAECTPQLNFLVMEYVPGEDLGRLLAREGPLPIWLACECGRQAALGLQHACDLGLVHRDIKPSNLLLTKDQETGGPVVRILDFGLARFCSDLGPAAGSGTAAENAPTGQAAEPGLSHHGQFLGTPDYISPEQARDTRSADSRSDLYSLGCTLFRLLTDQLPFPGNSALEKIDARELGPPPSVRRHRPEVPPALDAVLRRLMAYHPADRFQTPREAARALAEFARPPGGAAPIRHALPPNPASRVDSTDAYETTIDAQLELFLNRLSTQAALSTSSISGVGLRRRRRSWLWSGVFGGGLAACLIGGLIAELGAPQLCIDWPADDPPRGTLTLPGRRWLLPNVGRLEGGVLKIRPPRGDCRITLERTGHITWDRTIRLGLFSREQLQPDWQETVERIRQNTARDLVERLASAAAGGTNLADARRQAERFLESARGTPETRDIAVGLSRLPSKLDRLSAGPQLRIAAGGPPSDSWPAGLVQVLGHGGRSCWNRVAALAAAPEGTLLACVSTDRTVRVFDADLRLHSAWELPDLPLEARFVSGGRHLLVALADDRFVCYDVQTGAVAGTDIAAGQPFDVVTGRSELVATFTNAMGHAEIGWWQLPQGELLRRWSPPADGAEWRTLRVSPQGSLIALEHPRHGVSLYGVESGREVRRLPAGRQPLFDPQGRWFAVAEQLGDVLLGETPDPLPDELPEWRRLKSAGTPLQFTPLGTELLTHNGNRVIVWQVETGDQLRTVLDVPPLVRLDDSGAHLVGAETGLGNWYRWNLRTGSKMTGEAAGPLATMATLATHKGDRHLWGGGDRHGLQVWRLPEGESAADPVHEPESWDWPADLSARGERLVCQRGGAGVVLDVRTGDTLVKLRVGFDSVDSVGLSTRGRYITSLGGLGVFRSSLRVWDVATTKELDLAALGPGQVLATAWSPLEEQLAVARNDRSVGIWNFERRDWTALDESPGSNVLALAFSPGERELVLGCEDRTHWIHEIGTQKLNRLRGELVRVTHWEFSLDGRLLAGIASDRVLLYDWQKRRLAHTLTVADVGVNDAAFDQASQRLVVATNGGRIDLWDLPVPLPARLEPPRRIRVGPRGGRVWRARFATDGRHVITLNGNGTAFVIRLDDPDRPGS